MQSTVPASYTSLLCEFQTLQSACLRPMTRLRLSKRNGVLQCRRVGRGDNRSAGWRTAEINLASEHVKADKFLSTCWQSTFIIYVELLKIFQNFHISTLPCRRSGSTTWQLRRSTNGQSRNISSKSKNPRYRNKMLYPFHSAHFLCMQRLEGKNSRSYWNPRITRPILCRSQFKWAWYAKDGKFLRRYFRVR